jgi:hypothetical protein
LQQISLQTDQYFFVDQTLHKREAYPNTKMEKEP